MIERKLRYFMIKSYSNLTAKSAELMTGKHCENPYFSFLNVSVFCIVANLKLLVVENTHLSLLVCFNFLMFGPSKGFDSHESLPCFLSICTIAPLRICFDLKFQNMFSKIIISFSYNNISYFIILLQIHFCSISCQYSVI